MTQYQTFQHQHFHQGDYIFHEGDAGNFAYIIEQGSVEIFTLFEHQKTVLNTLKEGNIFGRRSPAGARPAPGPAAGSARRRGNAGTPQ
ncbi:MAG: cyclic nucleotide-binding domain-containing protein, partial [Microcystaceae cyanobacterium]